MARIQRRPPGRGIEWEFETLVLPKDFSRNVVTRMLVERAEHGGWELDRLRIGNDGKRRVVLRRKIIRQRLTLCAGRRSAPAPRRTPDPPTPARP
jgi:hypothetical protein